ncbi:MAG: MCE family protein [Nitrospirae bacterium]|nr:MCE family protein [Nitrospirota bacterium]
MKKSSTELKVGLFAIIVIIFLTYMTFKVGGLPPIWEKGYRLYVVFDDISGLDEQSRVKIAGVEAGIVEKIELINGRAKLTLIMEPDIKIYKDAKAYMRMAGLLGDRYLSLEAGTPDEPVLGNGDTIADSVPAIDVGMLANQLTSAAVYLKELTGNLNSILGETQKEEIKDSIHNLKVITANIKEISIDNKEPLTRTIAQLEDFTKSLSEQGPGFMSDMRKLAKNLGDKGPELVDNLDKAAREFKDVIAENRKTFKDSMDNIKDVSKSATNIARKMEEGEGTLGKLMKDDTLYNSLTSVSKQAEKSFDFVGRLRTYLDFHTEYNTGESEWKGYFDLTLRPQEDKYYILGIVTDPRGSVKTTETTINGLEVTEEEVESKVEFTAQFAKKFKDLALRIGLMENTFGVGADYFFDSEKGKIKFDMWDLSAREAESKRAHARIGVDYRFFKFFFVSSGVDNLINSNRRGIYVGGGIKFEDEDLKYLLGSTPNISMK